MADLESDCPDREDPRQIDEESLPPPEVDSQFSDADVESPKLKNALQKVDKDLQEFDLDPPAVDSKLTEVDKVTAGEVEVEDDEAEVDFETPSIGSDEDQRDSARDLEDARDITFARKHDLDRLEEKLIGEITSKFSYLVEKMAQHVRESIDERQEKETITQNTLNQELLEKQSALAEVIDSWSEKMAALERPEKMAVTTSVESTLKLDDQEMVTADKIEQINYLKRIETMISELKSQLSEQDRSETVDQLRSEMVELRSSHNHLKTEIGDLIDRQKKLEDNFAAHVIEINNKIDLFKPNINFEQVSPSSATKLGNLKSQISDTNKNGVARCDSTDKDGGKRRFSRQKYNASTSVPINTADQSEITTEPIVTKEFNRTRYFNKKRRYFSNHNKNNNGKPQSQTDHSTEFRFDAGLDNPKVDTKKQIDWNEIGNYSDIQVTFRGPRKGKKKSTGTVDNNLQTEIQAEENREESLQAPATNEPSTDGILEWKIDQFQSRFEAARSKKAPSTYLSSEPFYCSTSSAAGASKLHKMRVHLSMNGEDVAEGNHMSIFLEFMTNDQSAIADDDDDDECRRRPSTTFYHKVTYMMMDQSERQGQTQGHPRHVLRSYEPLFGSDQSERVEETWGPNLFVPHQLLTGELRHGYVIDDVIHLRVLVEPIEKVISEGSYFSNNGILTWRVTDYARRKQDEKDGVVHYMESEPFYNGVKGYRMKALLFLNGLGDGEGTHASIFLGFFKGEFDEELTKSPIAPHKVEFIVRSQVANFAGMDIVATETFDPKTDELEVAASQRLSQLIGKSRFVGHEQLETEPFLMRDEIVIQVNVKPLTKKTNS